MTSKSKPKRRAGATGRPLIRLVSDQVHEDAQKAAAAPVPTRKKGGLVRLAFMMTVLLVGVLLGRAVILDILTPFGIAAYAVSLHMRKGASIWMAIGLIIGSCTAIAHGADPLLLATSLVAYRLVVAIWSRVDSVDIHVVPFLVMILDAGFRIGFAFASTGVSLYQVGMAAVDGGLAFLLTVLFLQMSPLFTRVRPQNPLRVDEVIALIILLASLLTGLHGVSIHGVTLEGVLARYVVLLFAGIGGAGVGGAVGVVTGVVLALGAASLSPLIGTLAFGGVLAGLLKEGRRYLVGLGFVIGTTVLSLYMSSAASAEHSFIETLAALALFWLTPQSMLGRLSRLVPGTQQHWLSQQDHVRRIKHLMTTRIQDVSTVFSQLAVSFQELAEPVHAPDASLHQTVDLTVNELCRHCRKYDKCWTTDLYDTYQGVRETLDLIEERPEMTVQDIPKSLYSRCIKLDQMLPSLKRSSALVARDVAIVTQLRESRQMVVAQLTGVARIMSDLAAEIKRETGDSQVQEEKILDALSRLGLEVQGVDIISLEEGKVEIEVLQMNPSGHDECSKLVAPLLSDALGETITVQKTDVSEDGSYQLVTLSSAKLYDVQAGFASAAKDGTLQSGDSFSVLDVGNGRYAIALSDGMGNGERANQESAAAVRLVQQLLKAGFDEQVAVKTVNSALVLRATDEVYATLDLAVIDLYSLQTEFLKVGSVCSFVKQGRRVGMITGESVPIGIISDIDVQTQRQTLHEDDILVFVSDGILEAVSHMSDPEDWVRRQLERYDTKDPQVIADLLLEASVRAAGGLIADDMTVVCARIDRYTPQWATIRIPDVPHLRDRSRRRSSKGGGGERLAHV
ncbi:MAG: stage II sporulation protein E [Firmicutes bacterium]|nr:stage II sporulation protein E [Bacillota bacterium]